VSSLRHDGDPLCETVTNSGWAPPCGLDPVAATKRLKRPADPGACPELILSCRHWRSAIEVIPEGEGETKVVPKLDRK
jgi:hypothetical protein